MTEPLAVPPPLTPQELASMPFDAALAELRVQRLLEQASGALRTLELAPDDGIDAGEDQP